MILDNELTVAAPPDEVFALVNDVERVATCLPGAVLDGRDGDTYRGRVTVKVGPIRAAYGGTVRFLDVTPDERRLRLAARGADSHGSGDAEAEVELSVVPDGAGSILRLHTDLVIRGKIAQFGKGAVVAVSDRLLDRFAQNLAAQLDGSAAPASPERAAAVAPSSTAGPADPDGAVDGLGMLLPPNAGRIAAAGAALAVAFLQGWMAGRLRGQRMLIEELRRDR
ncbi:SRPBCC family protein [Pseudonocardia sp. KRD-184]|uniref:SRPBCC family protein n=1 Tax=Pseudonocardia oceani TaxID=2792013 RepID=A0ABS6U836_9PSEU|nr:SRPBCC family protein [Pseudonocardia oceani]MBW0088681.1 SRPBCC family protein [Pseudonocardia oceani]MBW0095558.1 SRPBCC family protein [Pseudonocardia oceani]MBW0108204.1 SRPBCC family protein [Pseudonocardia oceani]MBW0120659.1 SRPBCC family protein [Pseudonocardia oceani]MBW0128407.1 SRPBCC family protein [Pseudonocardia oceani]